MTVHLVSLKDCPPQPWRNGGGLTRELLAWPSAADWAVRISVARIDRDGAFSSFAGLQRWFAVLQGHGVRLQLPQGPVTQTAASEPLAFDGEAAPMCTLLDGATEDLNLMARRDAGRARMARALPGGGRAHALVGTPRWRGLFTLQSCTLLVGSQALPLAGGTLAWSDDVRHTDHDTDHDTDWQLEAQHRTVAAWWLSLET